jgi:nucleotide-binding universal stress UspA family protein
MKNFVVPIDFSKDSLKGLEMAILFSQKMNINIQMVYVQKAGEDYRPGSFEDEHKFAENNFLRIIKEHASKLKNDSKLGYIIKKGKIYREVINQAESYNDGVISASTHGASGFEDIFIGSNAFRIISSTRKPVFTLNKGHAPKDIKRIVVPLRLHVDTRQKIPWAAEIAELFDAEIHVITISTSQSKKDTARLNAYQAQSIEYVEKRKIRCISKKLVGDSLSTLTIVYAKAINADLVTIMTEKTSGWNLVTGSYVQDILNKCPAPVLSITAGEKHLPRGFTIAGR